ncbi:MAG TPA: FtsX-like permease family protein [Acidimicrobiales bacterium]|nr:FtsX-like permease family protein [Acidimicrobiales bacterium]
MGPLFLLRWSARDLRRRWLQVAAIALIIAIGTGVYSALGSTATWRRESNDASFAALGMYDLRVKAAEGVDAPVGAMLAALDGLPAGFVERAEERLVVPTQVDASTAGETVLVPGRIVGVDVTAGGPQLNQVWVERGDGRTLGADDVGASTVVLERKFAAHYDLPPTGEVRVGGTTARYVGQGDSPEYFFVVTEEGGFFAEANFAVVFTSLETAQQLAGRVARVNDLLIRLAPGVDRAEARRAVTTKFTDTGLGVTVLEPRDEDAYRVLYDDIDSDQKFWNVFAALILAGATFGAFNLASRMVEAQRREIGIGMALGFTRRRLMFRPLLVGVEIAVLGVVFGIGVGLAVDAALRPVFTGMLPLPVWHTDFQPATFARGAALGFVLPVLATGWPVWRAVKVQPVDAIATTNRSARGGLSRVLRHLPWPRSTYNRMPVGDVLRTPRRTSLTALGIAAALAALIVTLGMVDSFLQTMDRHDREVLQDHPDRLAVALQGFHPPDAPAVTAIAEQPEVGAVQPVLRFGGQLSVADRRPIEVLVDVTPFDGGVWHPTVPDATAAMDGLVIARKAARDLGVDVGDRVTVQHPTPDSTGGLRIVETTMVVSAVHPSPFRFAAYLDRRQLSELGLPDVVNQLYALPAAGASTADVQRALFGQPGVASTQPITAASTVIRDSMEEFVAIFRVLELFILLLALLIAYNAATINTDERRREHATLFAFGLPLRRIVRMDLTEGVILGVLGTIVGVSLGRAVLGWMTTDLIGDTMPELGLDVAISPATLATAVALGILAVALAPLLTIRRLRRMDIPGTLRVVE